METEIELNGNYTKLIRSSEKKSLTIDDYIKITQELLIAIKSLHDQGIVHLDLKPANIYVGKKNQVVFGDFHLSYFFPGRGFINVEIKYKDGEEVSTKKLINP